MFTLKNADVLYTNLPPTNSMQSPWYDRLMRANVHKCVLSSLTEWVKLLQGIFTTRTKNIYNIWSLSKSKNLSFAVFKIKMSSIKN